MIEISNRFCILLAIITGINAFSSHWNQILPKICSETTPDRIYSALLDCDQLMDNEAKNIFDECVQEVTGSEVNDRKPRVCYYYKKAENLDNCKNIKYKENNYNIKDIIRKELKHMWCIMKIARPLGWEQLCVKNLPQSKRTSIRRCDESFREITNPISQCYVEVLGQHNDGRPLACRSFEHSVELWECLENKSKANTNPNKLRELERKTNRYMDCLRNI